MNIRHARRLLFSVILAGGAVTVSAGYIPPLTQAVLESYKELLAQNPKDYMTLYQRASQYYRLEMYDDALNDIAKAIEYTPQKETEMLNSEYSLLSDIYLTTGEFEKALSAVDKALKMKSDSFADLYKKGNICLHLKRPEEAYAAYSSMQRLKSRSQEAFFGMARADIMMGKKTEAENLIKQAEEVGLANSLTYCRLGDLYYELGDNATACGNYLNAFALADNESRPLESLVKLANKDWPIVGATLDYALSQTDNQIQLLFLKANLAYESGNYAEAYNSFKQLLDNKEAQIASVRAQMARECLALNKVTEALTYADQAVLEDPSVVNLVLKSEIERAAGNATQAMSLAGRAVKADPSDASAQLALAKAHIDLKNYDEAVDILNELVMTDAENLEPLMLRAWVNRRCLDKEKQATTDYSRAASIPATDFPNVAYKAMAQTLNGKKLDGDATIEKALKADGSKDAAFWAAVYYAQTGNLEKGVEMLEKAKDLGYENLYMMDAYRMANLDLAPIERLRK